MLEYVVIHHCVSFSHSCSPNVCEVVSCNMASDWIFTEVEFHATPSQRDGMKYADEKVARRKGCDFIDKMSKKLDLAKLPQNSAYNFFHRFFMRESLVRFDKYLVAAACVLLGSKAEECHKKICAITREYIHVRKQVEKDQVFAIQKHDPKEVASKIVYMESMVLHTLVYDLTLSHPYIYINENLDKVMKLLDLSPRGLHSLTGKIKQVTWSFLNDSAYTMACLRLEAHELAAGAVYLACMYENYVPESVCTPDGRPWWHVLPTPVHVLNDAAKYLLEAYTEPYISTQVLPGGLLKLVHRFHAPSSVEENEPESRQSPRALESPMCVTSPECSSCDHDLDFASKADGEESPRETAFVAGTPVFEAYPDSRSSKMGNLAAAPAKRARGSCPSADSKRRKCFL